MKQSKRNAAPAAPSVPPKPRNNYSCTVVVGAPGTGKSTFVSETASDYLKQSRFNHVTVIDPQETFPEIDGDPERIHVITPDMEEYELEKAFHPGLLIIDDCRLVDETDRGRKFLNLGIRRRHKNLNIVFVYHFLADVHRKLFGFTNTFHLFTCIDNWDNVRTKVPPQITTELYARVMKLPRFKKETIEIFKLNHS